MRGTKKPQIKTWSTPVGEEKRRPIPCALCGGEAFKPHLFCEGFSYVRCVRCGLVQMNPQPEAEAIARRYGEGHGGDYLSYEIANEGSFLRLQELALEDAGFYGLERELMRRGPNPPELLDIGCATGSLLEKLMRRGWAVRGIEIGPSAAYARKTRGLDVSTLPLEENHFPPNTFDLVLASHLIEHLNDPASFAGEVRRILVPGGRFLVTTPNIGGLQARLFKDRWRSAIFDHLYLFSIKTLSALLIRAGFSVEKTVTWGGLAAGTAPLPLKRLFDRAAKPLGFGDVMLLRGRKV